MYESRDKMVSHPNHYQSKAGLEVIDVIEAFTEDLNGIEAVDTANVLKYICRWKQKNGKQDLEKAMWYLQHLLDHIATNRDISDVADICTISTTNVQTPINDTHQIQSFNEKEN